MLKLSDRIGSVLNRKSREIWSVTPEQTVYEAIQKMADTGVGALLVISEKTGRQTLEGKNGLKARPALPPRSAA